VPAEYTTPARSATVSASTGGGSFHGGVPDGNADYPEGMTSEGGETGTEPSVPDSPRRFGQLPGLVVPDDVDEPLPEDDWPTDVEDLSEELRESEADIAAGRTLGEEQIRAHYGLPRSDTGSAEPETAYLLRSPENARRLREAITRDKTAGK
jgi:PHD/YefM family antitoxin component YafN of YafNO toxin-antitoxin module